MRRLSYLLPKSLSWSKMLLGRKIKNKKSVRYAAFSSQKSHVHHEFLIATILIEELTLTGTYGQSVRSRRLPEI